MNSVGHFGVASEPKRARRVWQVGLAFTLTELLAVVAMVIVLAVLLLPCLNRAKRLAKAIGCRSNLRQLAMGLRLYVDDFNSYPPVLQDLSKPNSPISWRERLLPYCDGNDRIFLCPAIGPWYWCNASGTENDFFGGTGSLGLVGREQGPQPESKVLNPSDMIAILHIDYVGYIGFGWPGSLLSLHEGGENAAFSDAHVEFSKSSQFPQETDAHGFARFKPDAAYAKSWNNDNESHPETWQR